MLRHRGFSADFSGAVWHVVFRQFAGLGLRGNNRLFPGWHRPGHAIRLRRRFARYGNSVSWMASVNTFIVSNGGRCGRGWRQGVDRRIRRIRLRFFAKLTVFFF